jgi:hypothetical protein
MKRHLDRELEELSEELLEDLKPADRMQLVLEAQAKDNDQWIERLVETAPRKTYEATDLAYKERTEWALQFLQDAVYDLHTTLLRHKLLDVKQWLMVVLDARDDEPVDGHDEGGLKERADRMTDWFMELYTQYHAYRQFASEVLGIDIDTWFESHPDGPAVLTAVRDRIDDETRQEHATEVLNTEVHGEDVDPDDADWLTLDALADQRFERKAALWQEALETIPE